MNQWIRNTLLGIVVVPVLILSWANLQAIWASPEKVKAVEQKLTKQEEVQNQLSKLVVEQQARIDKSEAITNLQVQSVKESIQLIADIRKEPREPSPKDTTSKSNIR